MRSITKAWRFLLVAVALFNSAAFAASFTASLDRDTITLGESATLSLAFEGGQPGKVEMQRVPGLQVVQVGTSTSMNSDFSGHSSMVITYTLSVTPDHAGDFTIPAIAADIKGQNFTSQPIKLTVAKTTTPPPEANSAGQIAFLKLSLPKDKVYVGEAIVARLDLYLRDEVQNFGNFQLTGAADDGFSAGTPVELRNQRRQVQVGNRTFTVVPYGLPLTVVKTGKFILGPFSAGVTLVVPAENQGGDAFLNRFFMQQVQKPVTLTTESIPMELRPLPDQNKPANFNGAVGDYTMNVTAGPTNITVGDPVTVHVQIIGRGALEALTLPAQDGLRDFKTYPPTTKVEPTDQFGFQGAKTFEQLVSPQNADVHEFPALTFSYFNPNDGQYHTLNHAAVPLVVHATAANTAPALASGRNNTAAGNQAPQDVLPLKQSLGTLSQNESPLVARSAFLAAQSFPVLAFLAAFIWRKRADDLANNPRLRRRRAVAQLVAAGLGDLKKYAAANQPDEFFATLFRLLQEQLGERLACPASAITENVVEEHALLRGAPAALRDALREQFQLCNQARYAPVRGTSELNSVAAQFEKLIRELQELKG